VNSISLPITKYNIINKPIDHIVYSVTDLDEAVNEFEQKLGIKPILGGYHKTFGTKNALINLNNQMYLELLAADDSNSDIAQPRWMGVDLLTKNQITRWAVKSNSLDKDSAILKKYNQKMGEIREGSRITADGSLLQWQLIMPLPAPEVELIPFFLDWSKTEKHPSQLLPNMGCELIAFYATHTNPILAAGILKELESSLEIKTSNEISLKAVIKCPNGILEI
jgi:hypothetical protein